MYSAKKILLSKQLLDTYENFIDNLTPANVNYSQLAILMDQLTEFKAAVCSPSKKASRKIISEFMNRLLGLWCKTSKKNIDFSVKKDLWNELNDFFFMFILDLYSQRIA